MSQSNSTLVTCMEFAIQNCKIVEFFPVFVFLFPLLPFLAKNSVCFVDIPTKAITKETLNLKSSQKNKRQSDICELPVQEKFLGR